MSQCVVPEKIFIQPVLPYALIHEVLIEVLGYVVISAGKSRFLNISAMESGEPYGHVFNTQGMPVPALFEIIPEEALQGILICTNYAQLCIPLLPPGPVR